jgi:hypothetical protein
VRCNCARCYVSRLRDSQATQAGVANLAVQQAHTHITLHVLHILSNKLQRCFQI